MDATRYLVMSGIERAKVKPVEKPALNVEYQVGGEGTGWLR